MDALVKIIFAHAHIAHFITFTALILAGFNIPISEDLLIIISGIIASTIVPENSYKIFLAILLGCYISDNISYWTGRLLGRRLWNLKWFKRTIPTKKLDKAQSFYKRHGFKTLIIGRFIPFGVRNCLFLTAGMGKMKYGRFLISDGIACFITNIILFSITFYFGKNHEIVFRWLKTFHLLFLALATSIISIVIIIYVRRKRLKLLQK